MKLYFILSLLFSILCTEIYCNFNNSLLVKDKFTSKKLLMQRWLMESFQFISSRITLHRNQLNLSSWHGQQEVYLKSVKNIKEVEFDFYLRQTRFSKGAKQVRAFDELYIGKSYII